jgi:hypothetical protein
VVVDVLQQNPSASGDNWTSFGLHASRIFTVPLKVPVRDAFAQRTAPCATTGMRSVSTAVARIRMSNGLPCPVAERQYSSETSSRRRVEITLRH